MNDGVVGVGVGGVDVVVVMMVDGRYKRVMVDSRYKRVAPLAVAV